MTFPTRPDFEFERGYWSATTTNVYWICGICHDTVCHLYFDEIKMAYEYNPKAYYALYGKHRELIAAGDLGKLEIVVRDDNEKGESFSALDIRRIEYIKRVHCATSGLGISTEHLDAERPLVGALYSFYTYYHVSRGSQLVCASHYSHTPTGRCGSWTRVVV